MFIKICGITTVDDALLATALGADAVGFVMAPSPRQIAVPRVQEIVRRLPSGVLTVGVFRVEAPQRVVDVVNRCGFKAVQLSGRESIADTRLVRDEVSVVIKAFPGGSGALAVADRYGADMVMVDSDTPGSGQVFDWSLAEGAPRGIKLIMAGGLSPENVGAAIAKVRPWGVDVATGVELSPGRKDPARMRAFINAARSSAPMKTRTSVSAAGEVASVGLGPADPAAGGATPYDWQQEGRW